MSIILNIETATDICSVCISKGLNVLSEQTAPSPYTHTEVILSLIRTCIAESGFTLDELDAVAVSQGPGSYTALRVGASTAKGICFAMNIPLIAVDTLQSIALAAKEKKDGNRLYCPMIDARRMEVYMGLYNQQNTLITPPHAQVVLADTFDDYFKKRKTIVFCGNGAEKCKYVLQSPYAVFKPEICAARHLVPLALKSLEEGNFSDPAYFVPFYCKPPNITKSKKRL